MPVQSGLFYLIYRQRYLRRWSPEIFAGRVVTLAALPAGNADETENEGKKPVTKLSNGLISLELLLHCVDSMRVDGIKITSTLFSKISGERSRLQWCSMSPLVYHVSLALLELLFHGVDSMGVDGTKSRQHCLIK